MSNALNDEEGYLRKRWETIDELEGEYVTSDERIWFRFVRRRTPLKLAADSAEQQALIQKQRQRRRRKFGLIIGAVILTVGAFLYTVLTGLVASWIQKDCNLGIRDFWPPKHFIEQFKEKCLR